MSTLVRMRGNTVRALVFAALGVFMVMALAACGGDTASSGSSGAQPAATTAPAGDQAAVATPTTAAAGGSGQASGSGAEVKVSLTEWGVAPSPKDLTAGSQKIDVTNDGQFTHNLVILQDGKELARTPNFKQAEGPKELAVELKAGTYTFLCDIPGHAERGMKTDVTVK